MELVPTRDFGTRFLPLVQLYEMPSFISLFSSHVGQLAADPLLPHNVGNITWDMKQPREYACSVFIEERLRSIFNNHLYIEDGLQTAYTAATFFLLQNGVVKDVIKLDGDKHSLNFQHNTQRVALLASIPNQNAWLTLGGCAVLVLGLCSVLLWARTTSKSTTSEHCGSLGRVTTPHVVARVMLDSVHFPPLFLHRRVIHPNATDGLGENKPAPSVEGFVIDGLALQPPREANEQTSSARQFEVYFVRNRQV